jgi:hypothetical protein
MDPRHWCVDMLTIWQDECAVRFRPGEGEVCTGSGTVWESPDEKRISKNSVQNTASKVLQKE